MSSCLAVYRVAINKVQKAVGSNDDSLVAEICEQFEEEIEENAENFEKRLLKGHFRCRMRCQRSSMDISVRNSPLSSMAMPFNCFLLI